MRLLPQRSTLRKCTLLYRKIRHRRGDGVHSPFVFNLITKVIRERAVYYCFQEIEALRKELLQSKETILCPDRRHKGKFCRTTVAAAVKREAVRPKYGALLFRLTNRFRSKSILQIGSSLGLSTLYLTLYAPALKCVSLERVPAFASIAGQLYSRAARTAIDVRIGDYKELLPGILREMGTVDFLFLNGRREQEDMLWLFTACLPYLTDDAVLVCEGIKSSRAMRCFWKEVCRHPEVTVTLDLFAAGIVFFDKKLYKRNYTVYY